MSVATSPTIELKATLEQLRKGLEEAVSQKASIETVTKLQTQVDAIDMAIAQKHFGGGPQQKTIGDTLKENESISRLLKDRKGSAYFTLEGNQVAQLMSRKTIISNLATGSSNGDTLNPVGAATTGVLQFDRTPGIVPEARQQLKLEDVLSSRPTSQPIVDFVRVSSPLSIASPVAEASLKPENSVSFTTVSEKVRTIATWIPATRQVLDDFGELMGFLQSSLPYYVDLETELQLLAGDGTGENLHGLIAQASTFSTSLLPSATKGWNKIDVVGAAIQQINSAKELQPTFIVLNVTDWWGIRLTKDGFGRYILGEPQSAVQPTLFGLTVIPTTSIGVGVFLVGSGSPAAAEIRERMKMEFEVSTEHSNFFTYNMVACRAERRLCLVTKRPNAFVWGTFTQSPA